MSVPEITTERIGPKQAEAYLERNKRKRKLSSLVVAKYANAMKKGEWQFDGSPIRFDLDGNIVDGQHRLWAVIESDTTQKFVVITGLQKKTFATIDTGKSRSFADVLSIDHPTLGSLTRVSAAVSLLYKWEVQGLRGKSLQPAGNKQPATFQELMDFFEAHQARIVELSKEGHAISQRVRGMTSSAYTLLIWITQDIDRTDSQFFFDRLADGIGLEDGNPILALRNTITRFINSGDKRRTLPNDTAIAFGIKAWNYFRAGDQVKLITYRPGGASPEAFPYPR